MTVMTTYTPLPFPHYVIDNTAWDVSLTHVVGEFPDPSDPRWHTFENEHEHRKQQMDGEAAWNVGPACIEVLDAMGRSEFVQRVEDLTGIDGLIPNITGGGLHQTIEGGYLGMHTDSTIGFDGNDLYRRVNVLLFLNLAWAPSWGGALRLDTGPGTDFVEIAPRFNRLVIFETTPWTWHGHPESWESYVPRRSLACYYYTEDPPPGFDGHKETFFRDD